MTTVQNPLNARHLSLSTDHYTPPDVIEAARATLGSIDLDPASSPLGNTIVKAKKIFTASDNGFQRAWEGNVFLNPPGGKCDGVGQTVVSVDKEKRQGGKSEWTCHLDSKEPCGHLHADVRSSQKRWWRKLTKEWLEGRVDAAFFVGFSLEILQVSQSLEKGETRGKIPLDFPFCVPSSRLAYYKEIGIAAPDGSKGIGLTEGSSPPHASVLILLPSRFHMLSSLEKFRKAFGDMGRVIDAHYK